MKNITKIAAVMVCVLVFATTVSCDFSDSGNVFSSVANGEDLPAEFAIASGDPYLILECFAATYERWSSGTLSAEAQIGAALDMIDMLAVLSRAMSALVPFLLEGADPTALDDPGDFFSSADISYLAEIAENNLLADVLANGGRPAPLQQLWSALGLLAYEVYVNGATWDTLAASLTPQQQSDILAWLNAADAQANQTGMTAFPLFTAQLRTTLGL